MNDAHGSTLADALADRRFARERRARLQAEAIAEQGLRDLFRRQQEIQLLRTIADAANSAQSVQEAMQTSLAAICAFTGWPIGHYCAVTTDPVDEGRRVVPTDVWHVSGSLPDQEATRQSVAQLARRSGLSTRVVASGEPSWIADLATEVRRAAPAAAGDLVRQTSLRASFAMPVMVGREVAAVLEFFHELSAAPDGGRLELFANIGQQLGRVIERERARAQTVDAFHDALTQLPNRALFLRFVHRALERQQRYPGYTFAVLFIDIDGFKAVNDSLGHRAGDDLLSQIGLRLSQGVRATDTIKRIGPSVADVEETVSRLGGDEFTILLDDLRDLRNALQVAERIHASLDAPFILESGVEIFATASIGIARNRPGHQTAEDVLQDADIAMYRAKAAGKRRTEIFDQAMHRQAADRLQLETDLRRAVARHEFRLVYQPIVRMPSGGIIGCEALLRWEHPSRGTVVPCDFIPIAEETGAILKIGTWVLHEACRQLRAWQDSARRPELTMAVNVSALQFAQTDFVAQIARILEDERTAPHSLTLELTESVAMGQPEESRAKFAALKDLGVPVAIDDFGTGYSSLSYLGQFHVASLKIDRSFIRQLDVAHGATLVRTVLSLGSSLGLHVVAEGVETEDQADRLTRLGCVYAQGFHFHRPLEAGKVAALL